jgi:hypothetical protein
MERLWINRCSCIALPGPQRDGLIGLRRACQNVGVRTGQKEGCVKFLAGLRDARRMCQWQIELRTRGIQGAGRCTEQYRRFKRYIQ